MESSMTLTPLNSNYTGKIANKPGPKSDDLPQAEIDRMLSDSWEHYKKTMIAADGRPLSDPDDGDIDGDGDRQERTTVSEAVSYVLLRAVWMNDKETFAKTWHWAKFHMQRKHLTKNDVYFWNKEEWTEPRQKDSLFAWRYIPTLKGNEGGGIIDYKWIPDQAWRGSFEAATDADLDIAAALIFAGSRWNKPYCLAEAREILGDIWDKEVNRAGGQYFLFGGDQFKTMGEVNPSYMRPSYLAMFAEADPSHPWKELTASSYKVIIDGSHLDLHDESGAKIKNKTNLPPNWIDVKPNGSFTDSDIFKPQGGHLFGWDSFRTLFWVAEDYAWSGSPEAGKYLRDSGPYSFLKQELGKQGALNGGYLRNGLPIPPGSGWWSNNLNQDQFAMDGAYLAYFYCAGDREAAKKIYANLKAQYHKEGYWGDNPNDYYGQNWAAFGLLLVKGQAVNLFKAPNLFKDGHVIIPPKTVAAAPQPPTEVAATAPTAKLAPLKIQGTPLRFSKELVTFDSGVYHFSCGPVTKDPGFAIMTGGIDLAGRKSLKFEVKGSFQQQGLWAHLLAQVYEEGDKNYPTVTLDEINLSKDWDQITFDLEGKISKPWKIQFILATDQSECRDIQIRNLRFE
jgi:endo-1,4-beta-D-glucanase Y